MSSPRLSLLLRDEIQTFISNHEDENVQSLLLKHAEILGVPFSIIANQLAGRKKAYQKIPQLYNTKKILYPPALNLEQCSSESTARFKSEWVAKEIPNKDKVADLTGGFGIDSFFMSQRVNQLTYVEPDENLFQLAEHNHHVLGSQNIDHIQTTAENFLEENQTRFDLIYVDPSRRNHQSKKLIRFSACEPNVVGLLPNLFRLSNFLLIKASPLLDIQKGIRELSYVKKVVVVSVDNECRELLFFLEKNFGGEPTIETFNLAKNEKHPFSFKISEEKKAQSIFGEPEKYIYEPNASVLKSGAYKLISERFHIKKFHANTHLYTSSERTENFPGKIFKIVKEKINTKTDLPQNQANILVRNYPLSADELKRKLNVKDGGEKFVIAFSGPQKKYVVLAVREV